MGVLSGISDMLDPGLTLAGPSDGHERDPV